MAYKKDQGRYARMTAFWSLLLLIGYGCLSELQYSLRSWIGGSQWVDPLPLIGIVDAAKVLALGVLVAAGFGLHVYLNRPRSADLLIDTESELRKVTWPPMRETFTGTLAVMATVIVMGVYLFAADYALSWMLPRLMGGSS